MAVSFTSAQIARLPFFAGGGEAKVYRYKNDTLIKIYSPHINLRLKEEKVKTLITGRFPSNVYGPIEIVTVDGLFAGYIMKEVKEAEIFHKLISGKYIKTNQISNKDVLTLNVDAGKTIRALHKSGGMMGDYNDYNIMMKENKSFFIDVDSWGLSKTLPPDAYTEELMDPKAINPNGTISFSLESEHYNFAVLSFKLLTRVHPFGGAYKKDEKMTTLERMKKGISVLGNHDIKVPNIMSSYEWMSPQLKTQYHEIFEKGKRESVLDNLEELLDNLTYCQKHKMYYFSKYKECPMCNSNAKVVTPPVVVQVMTTTKSAISVLFDASDLRVLLNNRQYVNTSNEVVHIGSKRKMQLPKGCLIDYTADGKFAFLISNDNITIYDENDKIHSKLTRMHKTPYKVIEDYLYFVDETSSLMQVKVTKNGNINKSMGQVFNPLFAVASTGDSFIGSFYPKKAIIKINRHNFELPYKGKIREYAIKQDSVTKKWLFIYELSNGNFRTVVFGDNEIEYDETVITYQTNPLSNICFYQKTICVPADEKIIMISYIKNRTKEIPCAVVTEDSKLNYSNGKFEIINEDKIYQFSV